MAVRESDFRSGRVTGVPVTLGSQDEARASAGRHHSNPGERCAGWAQCDSSEDGEQWSDSDLSFKWN